MPYANLTTLASVLFVHLFMQIVLMKASGMLNLDVDVVDALETGNGNTNGNSEVVVNV